MKRTKNKVVIVLSLNNWQHNEDFFKLNPWWFSQNI